MYERKAKGTERELSRSVGELVDWNGACLEREPVTAWERGIDVSSTEFDVAPGEREREEEKNEGRGGEERRSGRTTRDRTGRREERKADRTATALLLNRERVDAAVENSGWNRVSIHLTGSAAQKHYFQPVR